MPVLRGWWRRADRKLRLSACALAFVIVFCPATAGVWSEHGFDPFEQLMLLLSWGALGYTPTT